MEIAIGALLFGIIAPVDEFDPLFEGRTARLQENMFLNPAGCERLANGGNGGLPHANGGNVFSFHHCNVDRSVQSMRELILQECSRQPPCRATTDNYNPYTPVHLNPTCPQAHFGLRDYS